MSEKPPVHSLAQLVTACEALEGQIDLEPEVARYRPFYHPWWMLDQKAKHYRMFVAYGQLYRPRRVLEVGTGYGSGAVVLARHAEEVVTADITFRNVPGGLFPSHVKPLLLRHPDECLTLPYDEFDFVYIDIDPHDGKYERLIHECLSQSHQGVVAYDDINYQGLRQVWDSIPQEKVITDWHLDAGFGLVRYGDNSCPTSPLTTPSA